MTLLTRHGWCASMLGGAAAGTLIVSILVLTGRAPWQPPEWRRRLDAEVPLISQPAPGAHGTPGTPADAAAAAQRRIINDLLRRPRWGRDEADELCSILRAGYPRRLSDGSSVTREERGATFVHMAACIAVIARLEVGAPIDAEARARLIDALIDELDADFPERRATAAVGLIVTKSIEDPAVRAAVDRLLEDRDPTIADTIAMQLARYDEGRARVIAASADTPRHAADDR